MIQQLPVGSQVGQYTIRRLLGVGGMAEVYLVEQIGLQGFRQQMALKRIRPHLLSDPLFLDCFVSEARLGGLLKHPNIVQTYEFAHLNDSFVIAMEYVSGVTLAKFLRYLRNTDRKLPAGAVLELAKHISAALAYAHTATDPEGLPLRVIHRDLKPDNILLTSDGIPKVTDFGIARAASNVHQTTMAGNLKGSMGYMSPEQASGIELDHRSDLYCLGIIMFEMLTQETLFPDRNIFSGLRKIQDSQIEDRLKFLQVVPSALAAIVERALAGRREERYQSAHDMKRALLTAGAKISPSDVDIAEWVRQAETHKILETTERLPVQEMLDFEDVGEHRAGSAYAYGDDLNGEVLLKQDVDSKTTMPKGTLPPPMAPPSSPVATRVEGMRFERMGIEPGRRAYGPSVTSSEVPAHRERLSQNGSSTVIAQPSVPNDAMGSGSPAHGGRWARDGSDLTEPAISARPTLRRWPLGLLALLGISIGAWIGLTLLSTSEEKDRAFSKMGINAELNTAPLAIQPTAIPTAPRQLPEPGLEARGRQEPAAAIEVSSPPGSTPPVSPLVSGSGASHTARTLNVPPAQKTSGASVVHGKPEALAAAPEAKKRSTPSTAVSATFSINSNPFSVVYLDNRDVGETPIAGLSVSLGHHTVKLVAEDGREVTRTFEARRAGETIKLEPVIFE